MKEFKIDTHLKRTLKNGVISPVKNKQEVVRATERNLQNKEIHGALKLLSRE